MFIEKITTFTSCLFMHIVSTEKLRKDMRDLKDLRSTKYVFFVIAFNKKHTGDFPTFNI